MKKHWTEKLEKIGACQEAVEWAFKQKSLAEAWKNCEKGNWMLWLAGKFSGPSGDQRRRKLVLAACECAKLSLAYVKPGEKRPAEALKIATAWAMGETVTLDELRVAAAADAATYAATYAAAAAYAAYAAYAAAARRHLRRRRRRRHLRRRRRRRRQRRQRRQRRHLRRRS